MNSTIYTIRAILDAEEDVLRDVKISADATLHQLHDALVEAFNLHKGEMSSFFRSNDDWEQGEEISMMEFDPETDRNSLDEVRLTDAFPAKSSKMLYVYDYLELWTFYLECMAITKGNADHLPAVANAMGEKPDKAPHREMQSETKDLDDSEIPGDDLSDDYEDDERDWY